MLCPAAAVAEATARNRFSEALDSAWFTAVVFDGGACPLFERGGIRRDHQKCVSHFIYAILASPRPLQGQIALMGTR